MSGWGTHLGAIHLEDRISNPNQVVAGIAPRAEADVCYRKAALSSLLELEGDTRNSGCRRGSVCARELGSKLGVIVSMHAQAH